MSRESRERTHDEEFHNALQERREKRWDQAWLEVAGKLLVRDHGLYLGRAAFDVGRILKLLFIISLIGTIVLPQVHAQTTNITKVEYPRYSVFDIKQRTADPPLIVKATVMYSDAKPGYEEWSVLSKMQQG
jgi:hypothetical protein